MNTPTSTTPHAALIGVFDSGVGGLSVLRAVHAQQPQADLLYVADSAHAPYGERSDDYIRDRTERIARYLVAQGAQLLVIACNTATAVAVQTVRQRWPDVPVVAVEPGLKPAVAQSRNQRVGVMATPTTLRSEKFRQLADTHGGDAQVYLQPCPGLAGQIEQGDADATALHQLIDTFTAPLRAAQVDTVVLGCTHYPFVRDEIQASLGPQVQLVDTADAVARQTLRLLKPGTSAAHNPTVRLQTTGEPAQLERFARRWLPFDCSVSAAPEL